MAVATYNNYRQANVRNTGIGPRIKCRSCGVVKGDASFSTKQQGDLQLHMQRTPRFNPATTGYISCTQCTPQQVVELECHLCGLTKGLKSFTKAQRKNPDHAECMKCSVEKQNYEGGRNSDDDSNSNSGSGGTDDNDDSDGETFTLADSTSKMSISQSGPGTYASTTASSTVSGGGVSLSGSTGFSSVSPSTTGGGSANGSVRGSSTGTSNTEKKSTRTSASNGLPSAFDQTRYGKPSGRRSPPSVSSKSTADTSGGGKFAKVKAVSRKIQYDDVEAEEKAEREGKPRKVDDLRVPVSDDSDDE